MRVGRTLAVWLLPAMLLVAASGDASDNGPVIPPAMHGDQCVADAQVMREQHMSLLNHQRDETVIEGIRGEPFSLVSCVNCHAQKNDSGQAIRIDAEGQFCESCHTYAAVKIDCFSCHAALPEEGEVIGLLDNLPAAVSYSNKQLLVMQSHKVAHNAQHDTRTK